MKTTLFFAMAAAMLALGASCSDSDDGSSPGKQDQGSDGRYKIGDCYNRGSVIGIVYKITDGGKHGMIVSLDEHVGLKWSGNYTDTGARDQYDGRKNMAVIREQSDWEQKYPAFKWCSDLNKNGAEGWYLPAYNELRELYDGFNGGGSGENETFRSYFNKCLRDNYGTVISEEYYWSSTEFYNDGAYSVRFSDGNYNYSAYKTGSYRVRAVRAF